MTNWTDRRTAPPSSIKTAPLAHTDAIWQYTADPAIARRALDILAGQHVRPLRVAICGVAVLLGIALSILAFAADVPALYGLAAAAHMTAALGWCVWFQRWR